MYDINEIKNIPIKEVIGYYNIDMSKTKGDKIITKIRNEKTPSTYIYLKTNSWFDFGIGEGGGVIEFIKYIENVDFKKALEILGERYNIEPIKNPQNIDNNEIWLSNMEWDILNLYGSNVLLNYKVSDDEYKYCDNMSMNDYAKILPESYVKLIKNKVLPYVNYWRQEYYKNILIIIKSKSVDEVDNIILAESCKKYEKIYNIFRKSIKGMDGYINIDKIDLMKPNLEIDKEKIKNDEVMIEIGKHPYCFLNKIPGANKSMIIDYREYKDFENMSTLESTKEKYPLAAFYKKDKVILKFKEKDEYVYNKIFNNLEKFKKHNEECIQKLLDNGNILTSSKVMKR